MSQPTIEGHAPEPSLWRRIVWWPSLVRYDRRARQILHQKLLRDINEQRTWFVDHRSEFMSKDDFYELGPCSDDLMLAIQYDGVLFKEFKDSKDRRCFYKLEPGRCSRTELYDMAEVMRIARESLEEIERLKDELGTSGKSTS